MLKKNLLKLIISFFCFSSVFPLTVVNARQNRPEFLQRTINEYVVSPPMPAKASPSSLHKRQITGRGIKIAIIDQSIHPNDIAALEKKGCILPSVIQKKLVLTTQEKLDQLSLEQLALDKPRLFTSAAYRELYYRKRYFDYMNSKANNVGHHGSITMQTLHAIAPKTKLLPMDVSAIACREAANASSPNQAVAEWSNFYTAAVHEAINSDVDAISFSSFPLVPNTKYVNALKEAAQKGIALIVAAGNGSTQEKAIFLDSVTSIRQKRDEKKVFEELKGKNMLFCGSFGYNRKGEETLSNFSQHPTQDTLIRHVLAPGENVLVQKNNQKFLVSGTSLSAPVTAGGFALLKQYAKDKGLAHSTDDLLRILHTSGHNLSHNIPGSLFKTYKVLNLHNAMQSVDRLVTPSKSRSSAKKTVAQPPKKPVTAAPKRRVMAKKAPVQTTKRVTVISKRRLAAKRAHIQTARRVALISKRRLAAKRAHIQTARRAALISKRRVAAKRALIQAVRRIALARKKRTVVSRKFK